MNRVQIPDTDSIEELARFWDTHDLTDFEDQMEEVTEHPFVPGTDVTIHLLPAEMEAVRRMAASKGVPDSDLIEQWVREKLQLA